MSAKPRAVRCLKCEHVTEQPELKMGVLVCEQCSSSEVVYVEPPRIAVPNVPRPHPQR